MKNYYEMKQRWFRDFSSSSNSLRMRPRVRTQKTKRARNKLTLACFQKKNLIFFFRKNASFFSWRLQWNEIMGITTQNCWNRPLQFPSQQESKPVPKQSCPWMDAASLVPMHSSAFLRYSESQSASHSAFQCCESASISLPIAISTAKQISHIISLQLCSSFSLPLPLPAEALMWVLLTHPEQK